MKRRLLIVGAGPKAMAIAAKAKVLKELGYEVPEIIILEKRGVASNWGGKAGFTDGAQHLGTPAEKDCGFPYSSEFEPEVDALMLKNYSWAAYLISRREYGDHVDRGRPQPKHSEWGDYLIWVSTKVVPKIVIGALTKIEKQEKRWKVTYRASGKKSTIVCDGLVMTGPGKPLTFDGQPPSHPRIFDGKTFWGHLDKFKKIAKNEIIGVIGGGETAAAIVVALVQRVPKGVTIRIVHRHGAVFSRGESFDENRWFTDPTNWCVLGEKQREEFIERTDRGVFSQHSKRVIDPARNVEPLVAEISQISAKNKYPAIVSKDIPDQLFDYLIVAHGFDPLWFVPLIDGKSQEALRGFAQVKRRILSDMSVQGLDAKLHLPMLAAFQQGPGFPNLSCLGLLADKILATYVVAKSRRRS